MGQQFVPSRGLDLQARLRHLEDWLSRLDLSGNAQATIGSAVVSAPPDGSGGSLDLPLPEDQVAFFDTGGHSHQGTGSTGTQIDHDSLTNVTADQHHNQSHVLAGTGGLGADHTVSGLTAGQVLMATGAAAAAFQSLGGGTGIGTNYSFWGIGGRNDVTNATNGSKGPGRLSSPGFAFDYTNNGQVVPVSGSVRAIMVSVENSLGGTDYYEAELYINNSPSGLLARVTNPALSAYTTGAVAFSAGDEFRIYDQRSATPAAVSAIVYLIVQFD